MSLQLQDCEKVSISYLLTWQKVNISLHAASLFFVCLQALGNENVLTTAGPHAQIFNIVNTYHQQNPSSSLDEAPIPISGRKLIKSYSYPAIRDNISDEDTEAV